MFSGVKVDCIQRSPWWNDRWISIRIKKLAITSETILCYPLRSSERRAPFLLRGRLFLWECATKKPQDRGSIALVELWKRRHSAFTVVNVIQDLRISESATHTDESRIV